MEEPQLTPPARILGRRVLTAEATAAGHTTAWRGHLTLEDGRTVFAKSAKHETAGPLRREALILQRLEGASFAARLLDWQDGEHATLVIEDLSAAHWPPPYPADAGPLFDALDELAAADPPDGLTPLEEWDPDPQPRWAKVAADPESFLRLAVCSPAWLERNIDALIAAETRIELRGTSLVHNDIYSGQRLLSRPPGRARRLG